MTIHVELGLMGELQRAPFESAVAETIALHPLLAARAQWRGRWPWWVERSREPVAIEWQASNPPPTTQRPPKIDILIGPGVRFVVHASANYSSILIFFHHSCCDGQGARRFLFDLLSNYEKGVMGDASLRTAAKLDELVQARLMRRADLAAPVNNEVTEAAPKLGWREQVAGMTTFFRDKPSPLAPGLKAKAKQPAENRVHHVLFEPEETANLRTRSQQEGTTFNDVAIALLMRTASEWNHERGQGSDRERIRITMPTDLRQKEDDRSPASNRVGYSFPTLSRHEMRTWPELLARVKRETEIIKERRLGAEFVTNITMAQAVPFLFPLFLKWTSCLSTAILTNLGDATRRLRRRFPLDAGRMVVGGLPLQCIIATPPVRPGTRAGFGMCVCGGRLALSVLTDPHYFGDEDTRRLLSHYVHAIRDWNSS